MLDAMPSDSAVLGFASRWYPLVVRDPPTYRLPSGRSISVIAPAMFLATKLEAFRARGKSDYFGSRDFGDVVAMLDGRAEAVDDVRSADPDVRAFIMDEIRRHMASPRFEDGIHGALRGDSASQARAAAIVLPRLEAIMQLA
ncbi:MAG: hypothetical protein M0P31_10890 [Solirubrobacteraceae bacterium]|nr:hypothetical protein [Solirubrobacteraceae bacterium]